MSEETKNKIKKNHADLSGSNNPHAKIIYQFTKDGCFVNKFNSIKEASDITGFDRHSISVASVHNKTAGDYLWIPENNIINFDNNYYIKDFNYTDKRYISFNKEVYQFNLNKKFIKKHKSCIEASRLTNIPRASICENARNKPKRPKKYFWRYKEDVIESGYNPGSFLLKESED